MKVYRVSRFWYILILVIVAFITMQMPGVYNDVVKDSSTPLAIRIFFSFWLVGTPFLWYYVLRQPYEIRIKDDKSIDFRAPLRQISIPIHEIELIRRSLTDPTHHITVKYVRGKVWVLRHISGFDDLLETIKTINPTIEIDIT